MSEGEKTGVWMLCVGIFLFIVYLVFSVYVESTQEVEGGLSFIIRNKTLIASILNPISITFIVIGYTTECIAKIRKKEKVKNALQKLVELKAQLLDIKTPEELMNDTDNTSNIKRTLDVRAKYMLQVLQKGYDRLLDSIEEVYWDFDLATIGDLSDKSDTVYSIRKKLNILTADISRNNQSLTMAMVKGNFIYFINDISDQKELIPVMNLIIDEYVGAFVKKKRDRENIKMLYSDKGKRFNRRMAVINGSKFELKRICDEAQVEINSENTGE